MKSEHRHELAENDLSKVLGKWGEEFDKHANKILSALIVVALIAAGIIYWTRTSSATNALGWTDLASASSAEDFQTVAETYAGTPVAEWATLRAADGMMREGIRLSLTDRPASDERLAQAKASFESLLNNTGAPKEIREQALLGYAVTLESTSDGDTNDSIAAYEQLVSEFPNTRFKGYSEDRIAELKTGGAQDFYAWFHRLNPKPAPLSGPQDKPSLSLPNDLSNLLPELGGSGIPETAPFEVPAGEGDATDVNPFAAEEMKDKEAADKPASETTTEDTEKPAAAPEVKPDEAPAAEAEKPAEPAAEPAESTPAETTADEPVVEEKPADEPAAE